MTDSYLVGLKKVEYPWIEKVYQYTSGYIHLSDKHFYNTLLRFDDNVIEIGVSPNDISIPDSLRIEALDVMINISKALCEYIYGWLQTKILRPGAPTSQSGELL